ncbi:heme ABC transporter ATP-binding protein [bacterium]|nr:heme ABC transporter ATP-binding protein [bacterium]
MLIADNLCVEINGKKLLDDVSISVSPGEIVVVVGSNGAGKTTLLKTLTGDLKSSKGSVELNNKALSTYCPRNIAKMRAVMPQHSPLNFPFCVKEVVEMGRAPHLESIPPKRNNEIVEQAMEETDIQHLCKRDYTTLSGGERQRVHFARVLAQIWEGDPYPHRYLLMDEPTSSLDIHHQYELLNYLCVFMRSGVGAILILHDLNVASMFADRVVVLKQGRVMTTGHPCQVFNAEVLDEAFNLSAHIFEHPDTGRPYIVPKTGAAEYKIFKSVRTLNNNEVKIN